MKKLSEKEIIRLMREEWTKKVNGLLSEKAEKTSDNLKMLARVNGKEKLVISPDLKVEKDNFLYTVVDANEKEVTLKKPSGEEFTITSKEFEEEFERE